ncbi:hypothetical protein D3C76_779990 [compost metagenome]
MLLQRLAQHLQQALQLLFAQQRAVGVQQCPIHIRVSLNHLAGRRLGQRLAQVVQPQGFGQYPLHAGVKVTWHLPRLHTGGQCQNPAVAVRPGRATQLPAQFHPTHARQVHVEQDQVEAPLGAGLQGLAGVFGKAHPVAITQQQAARHLTVQRHVFDHQDIQAGLG